MLAKARVTSTVRHRTEVEVIMKTREQVVFEGTFTVYRMTETVARQLRRRDGVPERREKPCCE